MDTRCRTAVYGITRFTVMLLCSLGILAGASVVAYAETVDSGTWGTCTWELQTNGTLVILEGSALEETDAPSWSSHADEITAVYFGGDEDVVYAPRDCSGLFKGYSVLKEISFDGCDTSNVTNMNSMFAGCTKLVTASVSSLDTSRVTDMGNMFENCSSLKTLDVSDFVTLHVANMANMFKGCSALTELDLSGFNMSKMTSPDQVNGMLSGCTRLKVVELGKKATQVKLPSYSVNGHTDWYSKNAKKWYKSSSISLSRAGIADVYSKYISIEKASVWDVGKQFYTGKAIKPKPEKVKVDGKVLKVGKDYRLSYENNVNVGGAKLTVIGKGDYAGERSIYFTIFSAKNPLSVKALSKTVKSKALKSKPKWISGIRVLKKGKGKVTYTKVAGKSSNKLAISKKTGKIKIAKGTKAGTYKIVVKVKAAGTKNYRDVTKKVTVKVKVK